MRFKPFLIFFIIISGCQPDTGHKSTQSNDLLTPPPKPTPHINGPLRYGVRPGSPFFYRIPCTGERPIRFSAIGLPDSLKLDTETGIVTGRIPVTGDYAVTFTAMNVHGTDKRNMTIVAGDRLALTPPMGWNSWYIHYDRISDRLMREAADQMISSGMADYGYQFVNIDDCWMVRLNSDDPETSGPPRNAEGDLLPNKRFPDMPGLAGYIHGKGLKAGLYISPGPRTCAGYEGSYGHEAQDAATFAHWGFDFLKYDWCSYSEKTTGTAREDFMRPYRTMSDELKKQNRDIVLNLCQYGMDSVWQWGGEVGHCWRTTGDLGLEKNKELPGFYYIGFSNAEHWPFAGPGKWNDPDYLLLGWVGDAHQMGKGRPTALTHDEQYSYMSMWCLMAAPLIFSGDMAKLDEFTLNVLCNHEVIEINQDTLGQQARVIKKSNDEFILAKPLSDGSLGVGVFNLTDHTSRNELTWVELGLDRRMKVRDLWRQRDLGIYKEHFETTIPAHGVSLVRLREAF
jgi:alpha-galactosidase